MLEGKLYMRRGECGSCVLQTRSSCQANWLGCTLHSHLNQQRTESICAWSITLVSDRWIVVQVYRRRTSFLCVNVIELEHLGWHRARQVLGCQDRDRALISLQTAQLCRMVMLQSGAFMSKWTGRRVIAH